MQAIDKQNRISAVRSYLAGIDRAISVTQAHEVLARAMGMKSKHVLAASLKTANTANSTERVPVADASIPGETSKAPVLSKAMYTEYSFLVGAMSYDALCSLAEDLGCDVTGSCDDIRADILEALEKQGPSCVKVEFLALGQDKRLFTDFAYLSQELIDSLMSTDYDSALKAALFVNPPVPSVQDVTIVDYDSEDLFTFEGKEFVNPTDYTGQTCIEQRTAAPVEQAKSKAVAAESGVLDMTQVKEGSRLMVGREYKKVPVFSLTSPPYSLAEMQEQGFKFDAILPFLLDMDMDSSNDRASELLTGNDCALQDICYVHEPLVIYGKGFAAYRVTGHVSSPSEFFEGLDEEYESD